MAIYVYVPKPGSYVQRILDPGTPFVGSWDKNANRVRITYLNKGIFPACDSPAETLLSCLKQLAELHQSDGSRLAENLWVLEKDLVRVGKYLIEASQVEWESELSVRFEATLWLGHGACG